MGSGVLLRRPKSTTTASNTLFPGKQRPNAASFDKVFDVAPRRSVNQFAGDPFATRIQRAKHDVRGLHWCPFLRWDAAYDATTEPKK